ncbi:MAG: hypothetical protein LBG69_09200 [Zoogloeaceae bacterium]|nr:hypothetical protein [Zoogloeaceae bacterium]
MEDVVDTAGNNPNAHGFLWQDWLAETFNVNAEKAGLNVRYKNEDCRDLGGVDIIGSDGQKYQPKAYASGEDGARSLLQRNADGELIYHGQIGVVPTDQLADAIAYRDKHGFSAEQMPITDRIEVNGVTSIPLTNEEIHEITGKMRDGTLPDLGNGFDGIGAGTHSIEAGLLAITTQMIPRLFGAYSRGEFSGENLKTVLSEWARDPATLKAFQKGVFKSFGAAGIVSAGTFFTSAGTNILIPGASILASIAVDLVDLAGAVNRREIFPEDFKERAGKIARDQMLLGGGTYAAISLAGPIGYLTPFLIQKMITSERLWDETLLALKKTAEHTGDTARNAADTLVQGDHIKRKAQDIENLADSNKKAIAQICKKPLPKESEWEEKEKLQNKWRGATA